MFPAACAPQGKPPSLLFRPMSARTLAAYRSDFDASMDVCTDYRENMHLPAWQGLRDRYAEFRAGFRTEAPIPKLLHQIWCGGPVPPLYHDFIGKMRRANPSMEYRLWTPETVDFPLVTGDLLRAAKNPAQQSDILRFEILNRHGGIYADLDFLALKSFDELLSADFFTGIVYAASPSLMNGLVGSVPAHPIVKETLARMRISEDPWAVGDIMRATGPFLLTEVFLAMYGRHPRSVALPVAYFCPFPNHPVHKTRGEDYRGYATERSVCVHMWHCSWMKKSAPARRSLIARFRSLFHA